MSAAKGNQTALKGAVAATSHLHIRVTPQDKAGWVRAAAGRKLAAWVVETLNYRVEMEAAGLNRSPAPPEAPKEVQ